MLGLYSAFINALLGSVLRWVCGDMLKVFKSGLFVRISKSDALTLGRVVPSYCVVFPCTIHGLRNCGYCLKRECGRGVVTSP